LRSETYFNFGTYIDGIGPHGLNWAPDRASIHDQSHGESFLSFFRNRVGQGIYILDEPEAALSAVSQMAFLSLMHQLARSGNAQFLIATHSPMLICYPEAQVYGFSERGLAEVDYRETEQYTLTRSFLENPERYFRQLFEEGSG